MMKKNFDLHIANKNYSSWSLRAWVLMKTLEIPFQEYVHFMDADKAEFLKLSPTGKLPLLVDGNLTIWDSLAIAEYLYESFPTVWPENKEARAFARSAAAEMHSSFSAIRNQCGMSCGIRARLTQYPDDLKFDLKRLQDLWHEGFSRFGGPYLAGDKFTAVDAFFCPIAFRVQTFALPLEKEAMDYVKRLLSLPAMQQWYESALNESAREEEHEQEVIDMMIEDLRIQ